MSAQRLARKGIRAHRLLSELFGEPDENSFGTADVAEPILVFILDHFADEFRAAFAEPGERIRDVPHREHDAQAPTACVFKDRLFCFRWSVSTFSIS